MAEGFVRVQAEVSASNSVKPRTTPLKRDLENGLVTMEGSQSVGRFQCNRK